MRDTVWEAKSLINRNAINRDKRMWLVIWVGHELDQYHQIPKDGVQHAQDKGEIQWVHSAKSNPEFRVQN